MKEFDPEKFVKIQIKKIKEAVGEQRALIAVSGGVDSSTCAVLTHLALKQNLLCVILDDAFMREGEPEKVVELLSKPPLNLPIRIAYVRDRFLEALKGLTDAEEKRKAFREIFYKTLSELAKTEKSQYLVQGTIYADILETKKGIKTQHNVLEQIGISTRKLYGYKIVEPLVNLFKSQVREVARYLKIPSELSERQPFPGPGLSLRLVGEIRADKLKSLKKATAITEEKLTEYKPSQYFATIIDNKEGSKEFSVEGINETVTKELGINLKNISAKILQDKATGILNNSRNYGKILTLSCLIDKTQIHGFPVSDLVRLQEKITNNNPSITRVLYLISKKTEKQPYIVTIRAVKTKDFLKAQVSDLPWETLVEIGKKILYECKNVSRVYYDVTPKPPATIEME
jgi:GMP synthase (glutamine-hydrolysing)